MAHSLWAIDYGLRTWWTTIWDKALRTETRISKFWTARTSSSFGGLPRTVSKKLLFVEYILESIKRLPVLRLIFIGYEKLAPCLFMFLIILESSHLLQSTKNSCLYTLVFLQFPSNSMEFYGIWQFLLPFITKINIKVPFLGEMIQVSSVNKSVVPGKQSLTYEHPPIWPISVQFESYINKKQAYLLTVQPIWLNYSEFFELGEREKYSDKIFNLLLNKYI